MLWIGWFGFNGGSALGAGGGAAMAIIVTYLWAAMTSLVWVFIEPRKFGKPSLVGIVRGTIADLATITPASGFVGPFGGICIGLAGGFIFYYGVGLIKEVWKLDESLDVFAVHGVVGIRGTLLVGASAAEGFGGAGLGEGGTMGGQFVTQVIAVVATVAWSGFATLVICKVAGALCGRPVRQ